MANNRMYLNCKKPNCSGSIAIAKFYPGEGWFTRDLTDPINKFFEEHRHEYDFSNFGGYQYELEYEVPE